MNQEAGNSGNAKSSALAGLLNKLDLPTLLMVLLMGGSNWLTTKEDGRLTREEAERAAKEIHVLHAALDDFETRQKETGTRVIAILEQQGIDNNNQTKIIESQRQMLEALSRWQENHRNPEQ